MKSQESAFDTVTYRAVKKNWFVLSGYTGKDILYIKTYIVNDTIYHLYLRYPRILKKEYNTMVSSIAGSFRPASDHKY